MRLTGALYGSEAHSSQHQFETKLKIKIYWAIEETTSFVTSLHIASFAFFRYLSVCHPHRMAFERRLLVLFLIGLWLGLLLRTKNIGGDLFGHVDKKV